MHEKLELQTQSYPINPVDCLPMIHRHLKQRIALAWSLPLSAFQGYKQCRTSPAPSASDRAAEVFCIGIPNKQFYKVRYKRMWRKIMKGQGGFPCPTPSPIYVNCKHMHMYTHMHLHVLYTNTHIIATWHWHYWGAREAWLIVHVPQMSHNCFHDRMIFTHPIANNLPGK